jgi:hypothetical protein
MLQCHTRPLQSPKLAFGALEITTTTTTGLIGEFAPGAEPDNVGQHDKEDDDDDDEAGFLFWLNLIPLIVVPIQNISCELESIEHVSRALKRGTTQRIIYNIKE